MDATEPTAPGRARVVFAGFLMGLANLVPGVSGGTMILALGLYDEFIGRVAEVTSLRLSRRALAFLGLLAAGLLVALVGLAGPAVWFVTHHRWAAYALFVGMTLGGVPQLLALSRPFRPGVLVAVAFGVALMASLAFGLRGSPLPHHWVAFGCVGALAASSMILPGVSGSYVLLIFGMYDVVVGSLRPAELSDDLGAALAILLPVAVGAALGIGGLSNVLKVALARWSGPAHGVLLGLLCGSVLGLWPFQEAVHPALVTRDGQRAIERVAAGEPPAAVAADVDWTAAELAVHAAEYGDLSKGERKRLSLELAYYAPSTTRMLLALGLLAGGFALTRRLAPRPDA